VNEGDELDQLVSELNAVPLTQRATGRIDSSALEGWLRRVRDLHGADLLLVAGCAPMIRANGVLTAASGDALTGEEIESAVHACVPRHLQQRFAAVRRWTLRSGWAGSDASA
jgi:hypothetical protein